MAAGEYQLTSSLNACFSSALLIGFKLNLLTEFVKWHIVAPCFAGVAGGCDHRCRCGSHCKFFFF